MKKLYGPNQHLKTELIEDALKNAKLAGKLPNVPSFKIKIFVKEFEEEIEKFKSKVGKQINKNEVKFLIKQLMRDKHDKILDGELKIIEKIILDTDFDIE
ncbi:hypothetical protein K0B03_04180 [Patescibacteria group bacterium]|nr:hypothetical protein [Patescibacteria group bacterium]